jgi:hypothetical protein
MIGSVADWSGGEATEGGLPIDPALRVHEGLVAMPEAGTLVLRIRSPRPLRLWLDGTLLLDEGLSWRDFQRCVDAAAIWPADAGAVALRVEFGDRPRHPAFVDQSCPSRNRDAVMAAVERLHPDVLAVSIERAPAGGAGLGLRFVPTQFWREGVLWQHLLVRLPASGAERPSTQSSLPADQPTPWLTVRSSVLPHDAVDATTAAEGGLGLRRLHVPVADRDALPTPLRHAGEPEARPEPSRAVADELWLTVAGAGGDVSLSMPVFEPLGRLAPRRDYAPAAWPDPARLSAAAPEPLLPNALASLKPIYDEAWALLARLARRADPAVGFPSDFLSTGSNFTNFQFVWDTAFTAMAGAYGHRALPVSASLDLLYSRQFDGGYIHRQHDVRDGSPALFEPDFSPNPPLIALAEWRLAAVTGDRLRLKRVYPALADHHRWLAANRRLPDDAYWTTGLASGVDNAPSLGEAYPDLTAQMAHDAEVLGLIAGAIGLYEEAKTWREDRDRTAAALNARCWNSGAAIYATGLAGGGHNPNKVVTAFWPLFAGAAPPDRVEAMARHAEDPASFGRHHPLASLAADSPAYDSGGRYWLGSVWPPTNYVAIVGLWRCGYHELARRLALRHLAVVAEVFRETGKLWENYAPDVSAPGSWSGPDFGWSALGPIALLMEVVLGLDADALGNRLTWRVPSGDTSGVRRFPLGPATVDLACRAHGAHLIVEATTDAPFTLALEASTGVTERFCPPGTTRVIL